MRYIAVFIIILMSSSISTAQSISWDSDRKLEWKDFQGPVDPSSRFHALTQSGVKYSYRWQSSGHRTSYTFEVTAYYDKSISWLKPGKATSALLAHEQLHFDISELYARILKKTFANATFTRRHESEIKQLFAANQIAREEMQVQYDNDTNHMSNTEQQLKWERYIANALEEITSYSALEVKN